MIDKRLQDLDSGSVPVASGPDPALFEIPRDSVRMTAPRGEGDLDLDRDAARATKGGSVEEGLGQAGSGDRPPPLAVARLTA